MHPVLKFPHFLLCISLRIKPELFFFLFTGDVPLYTDPSKFRPPPPSRRNLTSQTTIPLGPSLLDVNKISMQHHIKNASVSIFQFIFHTFYRQFKQHFSAVEFDVFIHLFL